MSQDWRGDLTIDPPKLTEYLLSLTHPVGRHKAALFLRVGFRVEDPGELGAALLSHGRTGDLTRIVETPFGNKYVVEGPMATPSGGDVLVRSVWFEVGARAPVQLVTVYPKGGPQ